MKSLWEYFPDTANQRNEAPVAIGIGFPNNKRDIRHILTYVHTLICVPYIPHTAAGERILGFGLLSVEIVGRVNGHYFLGGELASCFETPIHPLGYIGISIDWVLFLGPFARRRKVLG